MRPSREARRARPAGLLLALLLVACGPPETPPPGAPPPTSYAADGSLLGGVPARAARAPNLIVLVIGSLRADAIPALAGSAAPFRALRAGTGTWTCAHAIAPAPWSAPSLVSLLTGLEPSGHGCTSAQTALHLPRAVTTYAEALARGHGFATAAFSGAPWLRRAATTVLQGFEEVGPPDVPGASPAADLLLADLPDVLRGWAARRDPARPFFLFLHVLDVEAPYGAAHARRTERADAARKAAHAAAVAAFDVASLATPPDRLEAWLTDRVAGEALASALGPRGLREILRSMAAGHEAGSARAARVRAAYDAAVRQADHDLGLAVGALESLGLLDRTMLVVTSDHGEAFAEHGTFGHGHHLHGELVRVPLVIRTPPGGQGGGVVPQAVSLLDVLPTFFEHAGLVALQPTDGVPIPLPADEAAPSPTPRAVRSELILDDEFAAPGTWVASTSARNADWAYTLAYDRAAGTVLESLYDLRQDPGEQVDLAVEGRLPPTLHLGAFCADVERVRDLVWAEAQGTAQRVNTPYGAGIARLAGTRPPACDPGPR